MPIIIVLLTVVMNVIAVLALTISNGNPPSFHYECEKSHIIMYYVFNRFASEISYFLNQCNFSSVKEFNVISLGCGPTSELYGFIKSIYSRFPHVKLNFEGYDMNPNWERVQNITKDLLAKYGLNINFHYKDIFTDMWMFFIISLRF